MVQTWLNIDLTYIEFVDKMIHKPYQLTLVVVHEYSAW